MIKLRAMIFMADMCQFMYNHQIDGFLRAVHQKTGKADGIAGTAAAVACTRGSDFYGGGRQSHYLCVICCLFGQNNTRPRFQRGDLRRSGRRRGGFPAAALTFQMRGNPVFMGAHKCVNVFNREPRRCANQNFTVPRNLQRQCSPRRTN